MSDLTCILEVQFIIFVSMVKDKRFILSFKNMPLVKKQYKFFWCSILKIFLVANLTDKITLKNLCYFKFMWDADAVRYLFLYIKNNVRTEKEHSNLKLITFHLLVGNADILQDAKEDVWVCQVAAVVGKLLLKSS
jgi:hypothetical protein